MVKLDITILDEVGLGSLPESEKKQLFETFVETLELNVGTVLSAQMTDDQLSEFMKLIEAGEQEKARDWLEENSPNYKDVVSQEIDKLREEMKNNVETIKTSIDDTEDNEKTS